MTYEYISEAGNRIERKFSIHGDIPATVEHEGVVYRRVYQLNVLYRAPGFRATDSQDLVTKWQHKHLDTY
jgi:hypothetical protein